MTAELWKHRSVLKSSSLKQRWNILSCSVSWFLWGSKGFHFTYRINWCYTVLVDRVYICKSVNFTIHKYYAVMLLTLYSCWPQHWLPVMQWNHVVPICSVISEDNAAILVFDFFQCSKVKFCRMALNVEYCVLVVVWPRLASRYMML